MNTDKPVIVKLSPNVTDITVVATPNVFHRPMALAALDAGSHVLCEKPLAIEASAAAEMVDLAESKALMPLIQFPFNTFPCPCVSFCFPAKFHMKYLKYMCPTW